MVYASSIIRGIVLTKYFQSWTNGKGWIESGWGHAKGTSFPFSTNDDYSIQVFIDLSIRWF